MGCIAIAGMAGCQDPLGERSGDGPAVGRVAATQRMVVIDQPPEIVARNLSDLDRIRTIMTRLPGFNLEARTDARRIGIEGLPFLSRGPAGRMFSGIEGDRVLVRGSPAAFCPVAIAAPVTAPETVAETTVDTLRSCFEELDKAGCGCRVIAVGDTLLVPREDMAYATGITVRVKSDALGLDGFLIADERENGDLTLRDLTRQIGTIEHDDGRITIRIGDRVFEGAARPVGFRRGRLAERIYATDETDARISVLVGFDPDEIAQFAGAWLAWPPDA